MNRLLRQHPYLVNAIIGGVCSSLGDCITQHTESRGGQSSFDWPRNLSFGAFGAFWSVPGRMLYLALASRVPSHTLGGAVKGALIMELLVDIPIVIPLFTLSTDLMRGRNLDFVVGHLEDDFTACALSSFALWFPSTVINLRLVPLRYRVVWDSVFVVVWASVFSFITNRANGRDLDPHSNPHPHPHHNANPNLDPNPKPANS